MTPTKTEEKAPAPTWLSLRLDQDVAEMLQRAGYMSGKKKRLLVQEAIRKVYGEQKK